MQTIKGMVSAVIYRSKENQYTVFEVTQEGRQITCTGYIPELGEGETVSARGEFVTHPVYGEQFKVSGVETLPPEGTEAMLRYLSSGAIRGVGQALAARIVKKFGSDTMRILDEEPERLSEVRGISEAGARSIAAQAQAKRDARNAMIFLQQYGLSGRRALRIWETYGGELYEILQENPYRLAEDIEGIGFATADGIAVRTGVRPDSEYRIRSGLMYLLTENLREGSTWLPLPVLLEQAQELLGVGQEDVLLRLQELSEEGKVRVRQPEAEEQAPQVYSAKAYRLEQDIAGMLADLEDRRTDFLSKDELGRQIDRLEEETGMQLDSLQRRAVQLSVSRSVLLISGGPGTGKTTTVNIIIRLFQSVPGEVLLAAPTGRAARRMTEATGQEAMTIHRLLGCHVPGGADQTQTSGVGENECYFDRNEENPLEAAAVILDEMSMVDLWLMRSLLRAVRPGTKLILVGDANQLPSVGPGRVFGDLMDSGAFETIRLEKIFRQARESDIIMNAHRILAGEALELGNRSKDFFFLERKDPAVIYKHMVLLLRDQLPGYVGASRTELQVLTPMRKGPLGSVRLNEVLQSVLNPPKGDGEEITAHDVTFRIGDKVMQVRNNYQIEWEIPGPYGLPAETGAGLFNGDSGIIQEISRERSEVVVRFDENRVARIPFSVLEDLDLAYAITVHKSQGSEYPAVILPILSGPQNLMNRSLLYTAVTRARKCVVILGSAQAVRRMEDNVGQNERRTGLADRIRELP